MDFYNWITLYLIAISLIPVAYLLRDFSLSNLILTIFWLILGKQYSSEELPEIETPATPPPQETGTGAIETKVTIEYYVKFEDRITKQLNEVLRKLDPKGIYPE